MHPSRKPAWKKLRVLPLAAVIFLTVSGGPYGLEPILSLAGRSWALILLCLTPLFWDIPTILMVLELNSLMPVNGGYYQWVKRALGKKWAFYEGWWTWLYTFVDLAIYPVLFLQYATFFLPQLAGYKLPVCLFLIWGAALLNILGIIPVGRISLLLGTLVLSPFLVLIGIYFLHPAYPLLAAGIPAPHAGIPSLGLALYTIMWNYIGWDNVTTYAQEVERPVRSYLKGILIAFLLIYAIYGLSTLVAANSGIDPLVLRHSGFPALGTLLGGPWLGMAIAAAGMASSLGIFSAVLLSVSRVPKVMADDGLLPRKLIRLHTRFHTPYISILVCTFVVSWMVIWNFTDLLIIDVTLYGAGLFLEFISLIRLRRQAPLDPRPFRIPLGVRGLILMVLIPVAVWALALISAARAYGRTGAPILFALAALLTAEAGWLLIRRRDSRRNRLTGSPSSNWEEKSRHP